MEDLILDLTPLFFRKYNIKVGIKKRHHLKEVDIP